MGVLPGGPGDLNPNAKYGYTANNGSISGATSRTQDVVTADLKQDFYDGDFGTNDPWDDVEKMPQGPLLWSVLNAIAKSMLKAPGSTWININELFDALEWVPDRITEHTEAITTLEQIAAASTATPAWVSDIEDMPTAPRVMLAAFGYASLKYFDILDGIFCDVGYHYHDISLPVITPVRTVGESLGHIYYTPIVVDRSGVVDRMRWIVGADTSVFSIDYYEMALCVYNPDNGNIEKVWGSGNIKDAEAATTAVRETEIAMGIDQQCTPGQVLFVAHQQTAPGALQTTRRFAAVPQANIGRPNTLLLDASCYVAQNHTQGIPSSISLASLTRENRYIPWSAISVAGLVEETP